MPGHDSAKWAAAATKLASALPRARLHPAALAWAEAAPARTSWGVAFSGGPDSLALLLLLWAHWPKRRARLCALHFDHRMRGAESRRDAVFCRDVCRALKIKFVAGAWAGEHHDASEGEARQARLAFFARHARVLWLGHQQDDIAESMLMRLARGSGLGGLAAPRPVQVMPGGRTHLRPLLTLKKSEITAALRSAGVAWREDASNARGEFFRNRVRHDVLPAWMAAAGRDAIAGAARARDLLQEDEAALETWLDSVEALGPRGELMLDRISDKPRALIRRALHRWLQGVKNAGELSRQAFDALLSAVERGAATRHSLGREVFAVITDGRLRAEKNRKSPRKFQRRAN